MATTSSVTRGVRFRVCAIVLTALALSSIGCMRKQQTAEGELLGAYQVTGALIENSCGQAALPARNPLEFVAELRDASGVATWQIDKQAAYAGVLRSDGQFSFVTEQAMPLGEQVRPKQDLQPSDFSNLDPDFDLQRANCTLLMTERMVGTVHRMFTPDGGVAESENDAGIGSDLAGDNLIEVEAAAGADCSLVLAQNGGSFLTLPCAAHYALEGTLTEE